MKTKNQTEQNLLELAVTKAANDDGASPKGPNKDIAVERKQAWSPVRSVAYSCESADDGRPHQAQSDLRCPRGSCFATAEHIQSSPDRREGRLRLA